MKNTSDLVYQFKVMSDETRLRILEMLSKEDLCACHILDAFDITQPTLSYHMKMLVESQLVFSKKEGNWTRYSLNKEIFKNMEQLFKDFVSSEISVRKIESCLNEN